jgi:thymidylate kinase
MKIKPKRTLNDRRIILKRDKKWIRECDAFIAEVSTYSHGVGYEHAYAESLGKPILFLRSKKLKGQKYSAFLDGTDYKKFMFSFYDEKNANRILKKFFNECCGMDCGKFIVIYGANNVGKSTQVKLLVKRLKKAGKKVKLLKYPIYDLEPTGNILNKFLRKNLRLAEYEAQYIFMQNRKDFEPQLRKYLDSGCWVVAEDYRGTGICWGATHRVPLKKMIKLNEDLLVEDLVILLDGKQFKEAIEKKHHNEDGRQWERGRMIHKKVGKIFGWKYVKSDVPVKIVSENIWRIVENELL